MTGLNQNIWGPGTWLFLHSITLNYPEKPTPQDKERITVFFTLVGELLPCRYCRENFNRHIRRYPIRCESRQELSLWLIDIHNMVNVYLKKPVMSREDAMKKLLYLYRKETQNPCSVYIGYVALLAVFLGAIGLYWLTRR
jgi:hypothetical protein